MTHRFRYRPAAILALGAGLALLVAAGAGNEEGKNAPTAPGTVELDAPATGHGGLRAFLDPSTGELTSNPSPEDRRRLALAARSSVSRSVVGLRPFELAAGGRGLNLQGRFQSALRVEMGADGSLRATCGDPTHEHSPHQHGEGATTVGPEAPSQEIDRPVTQ